jgi:hypothetical protein
MTAKTLLGKNAGYKISDLIRDLEEVKAQHGDLPVVIKGWDSEEGEFAFQPDPDIYNTSGKILPPPEPGEGIWYVSL